LGIAIEELLEAVVGIRLGSRLGVDHGTLWGHVVVTGIVGHGGTSHNTEQLNCLRVT